MNYDNMLLEDAYRHEDRPLTPKSEDVIWIHLIDRVEAWVGTYEECLNSFEHEDYECDRGFHQLGYVHEDDYDTRSMSNNLKYFNEFKNREV